MATHSSILAWRIPWTEEPGGLQSMESHRVRHDRLRAHTHTHARARDPCLLSTSSVHTQPVVERKRPEKCLKAPV